MQLKNTHTNATPQWLPAILTATSNNESPTSVTVGTIVRGVIHPRSNPITPEIKKIEFN